MQLTVVFIILFKIPKLVDRISKLQHILDHLSGLESYEIIIIVGSGKHTPQVVKNIETLGLLYRQVPVNSYGSALRSGIEFSTGEFILTLDGDLEIDHWQLNEIWQARSLGKIIIGSRYIQGGCAIMPFTRLLLSRFMNLFYRTILSICVKDMSSSLRLYHVETLKRINLLANDFAILPEAIVKTYAEGWRIHETPFNYKVKSNRGAWNRLFQLSTAYLTGVIKLWRYRNSIDAADYDFRAYHSRIIFQRYWQRRRFDIVSKFVPDEMKVLDIGCGSSKILLNFNNIIGMDIRQNKLRFVRQFGKTVANGTIYALPFANASFDCVICSEVIEHVDYSDLIFTEFHRVLREGGILILGTPDYDSTCWNVIEMIYKHIIPGGYADEHITHYTEKSLFKLFQQFGFKLIKSRSILGAEIILKCQKD